MGIASQTSLEKQLDSLLAHIREDDDERSKQIVILQSDNRDFKHKYEKYLTQLSSKEQDLAKIAIEKVDVI